MSTVHNSLILSLLIRMKRWLRVYKSQLCQSMVVFSVAIHSKQLLEFRVTNKQKNEWKKYVITCEWEIRSLGTAHVVTTRIRLSLLQSSSSISFWVISLHNVDFLIFFPTPHFDLLFSDNLRQLSNLETTQNSKQTQPSKFHWQQTKLSIPSPIGWYQQTMIITDTPYKDSQLSVYTWYEAYQSLWS